MDEFINPPDFLKEQQKLKEAEQQKAKQFPEQPERDILLFLLEHAPLNHWQHDVLGIVRAEAYYFAPQGQTKIMNEGWASFLALDHHDHPDAPPSELVDYADHHSGTMATQPGRLNPYKLGIELFRDIEERWNKGQFGPEYEECDHYETRQQWDRGLGLGRQKIFEVRRFHSDVTFIDTFLTPDFCDDTDCSASSITTRTKPTRSKAAKFKKIKERLLFGLTNFGQPIIRVKDGNYRNRGELYLQHDHFGVDLKARPCAGYASPLQPPLVATSSYRNDRRRADHSFVIRRVGPHGSPARRQYP